MMKTPKRWWLIALPVILIFGCSFFGPLRLTEAEAEVRAGILCLPAYLPADIDPTPEFYGRGDDENPIALYKNIETSERVFAIFMRNLSTATRIRRGDSEYFDPYHQDCEDRFELPNGFRVCNTSARSHTPGFEKSLPGEGPPFVTYLGWLMQRDETWTGYDLDSTLSLEETKKIAASMCLD